MAQDVFPPLGRNKLAQGRYPWKTCPLVTPPRMGVEMSLLDIIKKRENKTEANQIIPLDSIPSPVCSHGIIKEMCDKCFILEELERLRPQMLTYNAALESIRAKQKKRYAPSGCVSEADVWPQYYDFPLPKNIAEIEESISITYWIADIKLKRNIKLSHGVFMKKGCKGTLLEDNCVTELLNAIPMDLMKPHHQQIISNSIKNGHHWIYANGFMACVPQIEIKELKKRKSGEIVVKEIFNYVVINREKTLFM